MTNKQELRCWIKISLNKAKSLDEFILILKNTYNVKTRVTNMTISYRHPNLNKSFREKALGIKTYKSYIEEIINKKMDIYKY